MNDKQKNIDIFNDTINIIKNDTELSNRQTESRKKTILYDTQPLDIGENPSRNGKISIINERTFNAASKLSGKTAVLNFASGTCPGGGVKKGSPAQEECLCRVSTLYNCLLSNELNKNFYKYHKDLEDFKFSDKIIYTPNVVVLKTDTPNPQILDKEKRYMVDVISSAAPRLKIKDNNGNVSIIKVNENEMLKIFKDRIRKIIKIAIVNNNNNIILGAFGCGAYMNNPTLVARAFKEVLINENLYTYFDNIIFAILITKEKDKDNFKIFENKFSPYK